jgi:hypothetical protein
MIEFRTLNDDVPSIADTTDRRMRHARFLALIGTASVAVWFGVVAIVSANPSDPSAGGGLLIVALAALMYPVAGAAFCSAIALSAMALVKNPQLLTPSNLALTIVTGFGALVFGYFVFAMFFAQYLLP